MKAVALCALLAGLLQIEYGCGSTARQYVSRGDALSAKGKYADAVLEYKNAVQKDANLAEAHYKLALADIRQGNGPDSYQELQRAVELAPDNEQYRVRLADFALLARRYNSTSQRFYDQIDGTAAWLLKRNPNSFDGWRFRGDIYIIDRKYSDAIAAYQKANAIKALDPLVVLPLVETLFADNRPQDAEALAKQALQAHKDFSRMYDDLLAYYIGSHRLADAEQLLRSKVSNSPGKPEPILQLADFYQQNHRDQQAADTLKLMLNAPKAFPRGRLLVGDYYLGARKWDDAIRVLSEGLRADPGRRQEYDQRLTAALIGKGDRQQALGRLNATLQEHPSDLNTQLVRVTLLQDSSDPKEQQTALQELQRLSQQNPRNESVRYNLGRAYLAAGNVDLARAQFTESVKLSGNYLAPRLALGELAQRDSDFSGMIRIADDILARDPGNSNALLLRAAGLIGIGELQQARRELGGLLQNGDSPALELQMAALETSEKKFSQAETRLKKLYQPGSPDLRPLELLTKLYARQHQAGTALKLVQQEVARDPDSIPLRSLLASTAVLSGNGSLAIQEYEWLHARNPNAVSPLLSLGELYRLKGDIPKATEAYQEAGKLNPHDPKIVASIAFLLNDSGREREAIPSLKEVLRVDPENGIAMNDLAYALAENGTELDRAETLADMALRKMPNNPAVADTVAWVYAKKGLNDSAVQILRNLVTRYPNEAVFRYHLGVALLQSGKKSQAKSELLIGLSKKPSKAVSDKINSVISKI